MSDEDWRGQVALITGGSGDIGQNIVATLIARGVRVASADLRPPARADQFPVSHFRADIVDVTDAGAVQAWVASVESQWGPPTIGILAAGAAGSRPLIDTEEEEWRSVIAICLDAAFYASRAIIARMLAAGISGRLVFVGSWAAHAPHTSIGSYSVAKAGLRALVHTLALDHAQDGILINEVAPGIVDAGLSRAIFVDNPGIRESALAATPAGVLVLPHDITRDVIHLVSPDNRVTTGATVLSDGGLTLVSATNSARRSTSH